MRKIDPQEKIRHHLYRFYGTRAVYWLRTLVSRLRLIKQGLSYDKLSIVARLRKDGVAVGHINDIFPDVSLEDLVNYTNDLKAAGGFTNKMKPFWTELWSQTDMRLSHYNPFVELAFKVLPLANEYYGGWSRMYALRNQISRVMPQGFPPQISQLWHRDHEDRRIFKFFLYLSDVDEDSGPFEYIKGSHLGGKWNHIVPQKRPPYGTRTKLKLENQMDYISCTGKAGTIIIADTAGLHRGGYCKKKERTMFLLGFLSDGRFRKKYRYYKRGNYNRKTKVEQYAIGRTL